MARFKLGRRALLCMCVYSKRMQQQAQATGMGQRSLDGSGVLQCAQRQAGENDLGYGECEPRRHLLVAQAGSAC